MLRDRLVCGLRNTNLQQSLLAETKLTLKSVQDRAIAAEPAAKNKLVIQQEVPQQDHVHAIKSRPQKHQHHNPRTADDNKTVSREKNQKHLTCFGCGNYHASSACPFHTAKCDKCGRIGHIKRVCRTKQNNYSNNSSRGKHQVNAINRFGNCKKIATVIINGIQCEFEVDTGSNYSIISEVYANKIWSHNLPKTFDTDLNLFDYGNNHIPITGLTYVDIVYNKKDIQNLPLYIASGNRTNVLGCNWFN
ncbi:uncharacterized protein LOC129942305 [Eupeodes corollae]|uniref:uncharacterized protein LOC129942305 n=1 Tax=Eupeodes corollae TaxID=290404 RepID=UPI0024902D7E|nr:uncharacterized protein LOC129942305 [Eupeodes corollae]